MSFVSLRFLIFFAVVLAAYMVVPDRHKGKLLLLASLFFYACSGAGSLLFLLATSLAVYGAGIWLMRIRERHGLSGAGRPSAKSGDAAKGGNASSNGGNAPARGGVAAYRKEARVALAAGVGFCLLLWWHCKYMGKILSLLSPRAGESLDWAFFVPLGISYYTLSCIGYLADVYWRKGDAEENYGRFLLAMIYFPQIVEGPIARYGRLLPQLSSLRRPGLGDLCGGLQLMLWGYFKKLVVADRIAIYTGDVLGNPLECGGLSVLIALLFSPFQLYADFSGCMDIAYGMSQIFGIRLDDNFLHPFFSRSVPEFWRRWHVTLGAWFKDYVYFPVATSPRILSASRRIKERRGAAVQRAFSVAAPLFCVWVLTGAWHGTGLDYIVWGLYYWALISGSAIFAGWFKSAADRLGIDTGAPWWRIVQMARTYLVFAGGLLLVNAGGISRVPRVIMGIFSPFAPMEQSLFGHGLGKAGFFLAVLCVPLLLIVDKAQESGSIRERIAALPLPLRWAVYYAGILAVLVFGVYGVGYDPASFVYEAY